MSRVSNRSSVEYWPGKGPTLGKLVAIEVAHLGERKGHHRPKQQHRGAADPVDHRAGEQAADRHQPGPGDHPQAHHPAPVLVVDLLLKGGRQRRHQGEVEEAERKDDEVGGDRVVGERKRCERDGEGG